MRYFVGVTDGDWFELLSSLPGIDEVNFWQPSGSSHFRALSPGELFLFKLHSPHNFIVGGGFFAHMTLLPVSLAWEAFGQNNGATTLDEMRRRIEKYRDGRSDPLADYQIGCILLEQPFFLPRQTWVPIPASWKPNIVRGKGYDSSDEEGLALWRAVEARLPFGRTLTVPTARPDEARLGEPVLVRPRLGQGSFRVLVTDAYQRRCAVTGERTLPVLQAAHIKPFSMGGQHDLTNGLLLRSDLHLLFDKGYLTVTPELRLEVSRRIREEFENGRGYYALHGSRVSSPTRPWQPPATEVLRWHNEEVFRG
jgi:putative restriction endonuclease